ncbi:MAG: NFACT family protein, partial [Cytophagales bacterium]|nr:NFACT family protein [Armatimonadota bacterium]
MAQTNLSFDTFILAAVAAELRTLAVGAPVQKVQQPSPTDLVLSLYGHAGAQRILISSDPRTYRIHRTQVRRENPVTPPGFCQVCRKYLEGAVLAEVTMPRFDRLVHLIFQTPDGGRITLATELMGRNANVILCTEEGTVRGAIRPSPAGSTRPVRPGSAYALPPGFTTGHDSLTVISPDDPIFETLPMEINAAVKWLSGTFSGISGFAAEEIAVRAEGEVASVPDVFVALMDSVRNGRFTPHSVATEDGAATAGVWAFAPLSISPGRRFERENISVALDTFYATLLQHNTEESDRTTLEKAVAREVAFRRKELASARATLAEAERADEYEQMGSTLLAYLGQVRKGDTSATLPHLFGEDGGEVVIALDPVLTPHENAERYFTRSRKARDAADYASDRAEGVAEELAELERIGAALGRAEETAAVEAVRAALT